MLKRLEKAYEKLLVSSLMIVLVLIGCTSTPTKSLADINVDLSVSSMLILALEDDYKAKATYEVIISEYGTIKPFSDIVSAEQTHLDLLLPLFDTYQIELPDDIRHAFEKLMAASENHLQAYTRAYDKQ